ncbi:hypothetical protein Mapa_000655 [Marchantia paleacea]|nr:hypothetical protein Mapa_000655 [Marchantia paleacea]
MEQRNNLDPQSICYFRLLIILVDDIVFQEYDMSVIISGSLTQLGKPFFNVLAASA